MPDSNPQHVAVPIQVWSTVIETLMQELPMKRVEGLVVALRQCQPLAQDARPIVEDPKEE